MSTQHIWPSEHGIGCTYLSSRDCSAFSWSFNLFNSSRFCLVISLLHSKYLKKTENRKSNNCSITSDLQFQKSSQTRIQIVKQQNDRQNVCKITYPCTPSLETQVCCVFSQGDQSVGWTETWTAPGLESGAGEWTIAETNGKSWFSVKASCVKGITRSGLVRPIGEVWPRVGDPAQRGGGSSLDWGGRWGKGSSTMTTTTTMTYGWLFWGAPANGTPGLKRC